MFVRVSELLPPVSPADLLRRKEYMSVSIDLLRVGFFSMCRKEIDRPGVCACRSAQAARSVVTNGGSGAVCFLIYIYSSMFKEDIGGVFNPYGTIEKEPSL